MGGIADSAANGLLQLTVDIAYGFVMETKEPAFQKAALYGRDRIGSATVLPAERAAAHISRLHEAFDAEYCAC